MPIAMDATFPNQPVSGLASDLPASSPVSLDDHWAVRVVRADRAAALLAYADGRLRAMDRGGPAAVEPIARDVVEDLTTLAGGYELAAREALGRDDPFADSEPRNAGVALPLSADRARLVRDGAARAFLLQAALPLPEDVVDALYVVLQLRALSVVGERDAEFDRWMAHRETLLGVDRADPLDVALLRLAVAVWVDVLGGRGPSGLDRAREHVALARERLTMEQASFVGAASGDERVRREFTLFALARLVDAATEVLLARARDDRAGAADRAGLALGVAGPAAAGTRTLWVALVWLREAAERVIRERNAQLELLPPRA